MTRKDQNNLTCIHCNKSFSTPQKLRQHYSSDKNQCGSHPEPQEEITPQSIDDLANWLANSNPTIISKKVPKTDEEWFDLMEKSSSKWQKKDNVLQLEEDSEAGPGP